MLKVEEYLQKVFEVIRIDGSLEEIRRISVAVPCSATLQNRETQLHHRKEELLKEMGSEYTPVEMAPYEQYIEVELQHTK